MPLPQRDTLIWPRAILHVDMDAFFVNVHILDHPQDAGIPLAVGGQPNVRGVVASASYEARAFGVRSAMPSKRAQQLCPAIKFVGADRKRISDCSRQVMAVLREYGAIEQISVDEAYVDLSEWPSPELVALKVRDIVRQETQLPASVGLGTSKLVAKVASDHDKPRGCTIVAPGDEAGFLAPMSTRVIWGVGPRTAERLAAIGVESCGQLAAIDLDTLRLSFGKHAEPLQKRAQGIDPRRVEAWRGPAKSISQERTFNEDIALAEALEGYIERMCVDVAKSVKKRGWVAHTVTIKFRTGEFRTYSRQRTVVVGVDSAETITRIALAIFHAHWPPDQPMRLLGVGVSKLEEKVMQQLELGI